MTRSLFLSDLHVGASDFASRRFEAYAARFDEEAPRRLFLVGDIVDVRHIRRHRVSHLEHFGALERLVRIAARAPTTYLWGNHDPEAEMLGPFCGVGRGPTRHLVVARRAFHRLADGRLALVLHGDEVDPLIRVGMTKAFVNKVTRHYYRLMAADRSILKLRRAFHQDARPLISILKALAPRWRRYVESYETTIAGIARTAGADIVLCGHVHAPKMRRIGRVLYVNSGDWVEHCTAVEEDEAGRLSLVDWRGRVLARCTDQLEGEDEIEHDEQRIDHPA